ncbi:VOC family protein [Paenibacillus sp. OV219]|uniref:VOC family protein n=1 Tax=Paenibacillus sp. OV219 TaxID=1884377 RepID=UPI0008D3EC3B|nr:VOC family protein [Paenibacillus sp. OV219]SEN79850.1 Predicted transcriptional regulator YdeE, contains AraC-type DNA-binding domain [Paenibacillus sp. OV219]
MITKPLNVAHMPVVASVIPTIFVTNLQDALEWYCRCLNFRVLAYNPHFATLEMSPGRICWIHQDAARKGQGQINFHVRDAAALHDHLEREGADVDPLEIGVADTHWYMLRDPDGNSFGVWNGLFGLNETDNVNRPDFPELRSYRFEKMPSKRCVGIPVTVDVNHPQAAIATAAERLKLGERLVIVNPILERYAGVKQHRLWVCSELSIDAAVPGGLDELVIPEQNYAVFSFKRDQKDFRSQYSDIYRWLGQQFGFLKTEPGAAGAYHLEMMLEDRIDAFIPYATGLDETHDYD